MVCEETRKPYKNNHVNHLITEITTGTVISLRSADVFPVVAFSPSENFRKFIFGGREATTGNTSALRRLQVIGLENLFI